MLFFSFQNLGVIQEKKTHSDLRFGSFSSIYIHNVYVSTDKSCLLTRNFSFLLRTILVIHVLT